MERECNVLTERSQQTGRLEANGSSNANHCDWTRVSEKLVKIIFKKIIIIFKMTIFFIFISSSDWKIDGFG